VLIFITFISSIWHPWLMTKWNECLIVITIIKNDYKSFDRNINNPPPPLAYLHTYIFTYSPTHLSTYFLTYPPTHLPITYLPTHPPTYLPTHAPTYLPTHLPTRWPMHPPTHLPTYNFNLFTSSLSSYNLPTTYLIVL
jgi:hypothetical protein